MSSAKTCGTCSHFQVPGLDAHERGPFCDRTSRVGRNQCEADKRWEWNGDTLYHLGVIYSTPACPHFGPINDLERQRRKEYREMMRKALGEAAPIVGGPERELRWDAAASDTPPWPERGSVTPSTPEQSPEPTAAWPERERGSVVLSLPEQPPATPPKRKRGRPKGSKDKRKRKKRQGK